MQCLILSWQNCQDPSKKILPEGVEIFCLATGLVLTIFVMDYICVKGYASVKAYLDKITY